VSQNRAVAKIKSYDELVHSLAKNIKRFRKQKGLTQEDMMDHGFNYRFYQKLESGNYSPNLKTIFKISKCFNVDIEDLFK